MFWGAIRGERVEAWSALRPRGGRPFVRCPGHPNRSAKPLPSRFPGGVEHCGGIEAAPSRCRHRLPRALPPISSRLSRAGRSGSRRQRTARPQRLSTAEDDVSEFYHPALSHVAGLSDVKVSVLDRTSHPSGSRQKGTSFEGPRPWRQAPQRVFRLYRPCPKVCNTRFWLPKRAPSLAGSRSARGSIAG